MADSAWETQMEQMLEVQQAVGDLRQELSELLGRPVPVASNMYVDAAEVVSIVKDLKQRVESLEEKE